MGVSIKFRRGTASEYSAFNGAEGEVTVQKSDSVGDPWSIRVHDGQGGAGFHIPTETQTATLSNKTLNNVVLSGTIKDTSGNLLGTVVGGKLVLGQGALTLDEPAIIDQGDTKDLEAMVARISRKNQMVLGD
tara:strand:+ start:4551 stop:4946 length:396 start_codon:yes stop_codon:yes gene_type:complete